MRVPYISDPSGFISPEDQAIEQRMRKRRAPGPLLPLDHALLHSPPVADGWNTFLGHIRTSLTLSAYLLESLICRIAVINRAWFEWEQHAPLLLSSDGSLPTHLHGLFTLSPGTWSANAETLIAKNWVADKDTAAALDVTDAMTLAAQVPDDIFARLRAAFSERECVEVVSAVAAYNCVSRFLVALDVGERHGQQGMEKALAASGGMPEGLEIAPRVWDRESI